MWFHGKEESFFRLHAINPIKVLLKGLRNKHITPITRIIYNAQITKVIDKFWNKKLFMCLQHL